MKNLKSPTYLDGGSLGRALTAIDDGRAAQHADPTERFEVRILQECMWVVVKIMVFLDP